MSAFKTSLLISIISYLGYFTGTEPIWDHCDETSLWLGHPFYS